MKHTEKAGLDFIRTIAELDQANYPEMMRKMFLINAPAIFTMIYSMLKPFIDPVTLSKVYPNYCAFSMIINNNS